MATTAPTTDPKPMPPVLGRLLRGTAWLALRTPLQILFAFWSIPLVQAAIGPRLNGAYVFAWGFSFFQFLFEFGMSSALQRQVSETYTRGDREGVKRAIACGTTFYAVMALVQAAALLGVAYLAVPHTKYTDEGKQLIVRLLWLQALTAPCFGLAVVVSSVLQAARRFDFIPRLELVIVVLRFAILVVGLKLGDGIFPIVVTQTVVQVCLSMGPALWVMGRELGFSLHFGGARREDFAALMHVSFYMFLIQLSVVLADKIDAIVLGFAIEHGAGQATTIYQNVSKGFLQIRQTGWTLSYLVMPAAASLIAARDERGLDRLKYDGSRFLIGLLLPLALLAAIYARPFLALWIYYDPTMADHAPLMQLFLVATLPLVISVLVQIAIGKGKVEVIALSALAGALVNLPLSYALTVRLGVAGVIWGTVLTTLFSNLLVPGVYCARVLDVRGRTFLTRTLAAPLVGAIALGLASAALHAVLSAEPRGSDFLARATPFVLHLAVGVVAYVIGYQMVPPGRADLAVLWRKLRPGKPGVGNRAPKRREVFAAPQEGLGESEQGVYKSSIS